MNEVEKLQRERDDVIADFVGAHQKPMRDDVEAWRSRYPQHAEAIMAMAIALHRYGSPTKEEVSPEDEERSWRRHCKLFAKMRREQALQSKDRNR